MSADLDALVSYLYAVALSARRIRIVKVVRNMLTAIFVSVFVRAGPHSHPHGADGLLGRAKGVRPI